MGENFSPTSIYGVFTQPGDISDIPFVDVNSLNNFVERLQLFTADESAARYPTTNEVTGL